MESLRHYSQCTIQLVPTVFIEIDLIRVYYV